MNEEIDGFDEIIKEFLAECSEHLDVLDTGFVAIEQDATDKKILAEIFRSIHTIKGGAGMLAFNRLEKLAHAAESLLSLLRDNKLELNSAIVTTLLESVDAVRTMLDCIAQKGSDGEDEYQILIDRLLELQTSSHPVEAMAISEEALGSTNLPTNDNDTASKNNETSQNSPPRPHEPQSKAVEAHARDLSNGLENLPHEQMEHLEGKTNPVADATIRINVELLDKLMNLVGELVLSRNQLLQFLSMLTDSGFIAVSQRLNVITSELQEGVMKTRMQPIGNVWNKFTRIVRDLSISCNKQVKLVMYGQETELDKTLIEAIKDPLTHIVRNSVDHGIESPDVRKRAGKPEEGTITLKAHHEGGHVNIEIHDDGAGISAEKVKNKAIEKGLISAEQANRMSEHEALNLIFMPGFSTAEKVTNISGRGVGMDVVRTNIERINGSIELQSQPGQFMVIKIKIPLTLAIIPALIITCQNNRYAIPQISLLELVRLESSAIEKNIQNIKNNPVYKLRGKLLPLLYLNKELELNVESSSYNDDAINIVILQAGETEFGLVVDSINDTQEIVVKPLSKLLRNQQVFAGATIMGDGKISLILDAIGIARKAGLLSQSIDSNQRIKKDDGGITQTEKQSLLLLSAGTDNPIGIPLDKVDRIEEFSCTIIERVDTQEVVQYRNAIMPLVRLSRFVRSTPNKSENDDKIQVIVHSDGNHNYGLVVDRIYDIVEGTFNFDSQINRRGIMGASVVENKVTEILDIDVIIQDALPTYYYKQGKGSI